MTNKEFTDLVKRLEAHNLLVKAHELIIKNHLKISMDLSKTIDSHIKKVTPPKQEIKRKPVISLMLLNEVIHACMYRNLN